MSTPSYDQLQSQLQLMTLKVDKITKENVDLKRDYEVQSIEKERLSKLVDQLKNEKNHLVETVLQLSNEVDTMHKTKEDSNGLVYTEMMIKAAQQRLGIQSNNDHSLLLRVCMHSF